jgi:hypothetical protein
MCLLKKQFASGFVSFAETYDLRQAKQKRPLQ